MFACHPLVISSIVYQVDGFVPASDGALPHSQPWWIRGHKHRWSPPKVSKMYWEINEVNELSILNDLGYKLYPNYAPLSNMFQHLPAQFEAIFHCNSILVSNFRMEHFPRSSLGTGHKSAAPFVRAFRSRGRFCGLQISRGSLRLLKPRLSLRCWDLQRGWCGHSEMDGLGITHPNLSDRFWLQNMVR